MSGRAGDTPQAAMLRSYGMSSIDSDVWEDPDAAQEVSISTNELDALGTGVPIVKALDRSGVNRSRETLAEYSIDSKSFSARSYIRDIHRRATGAELRRGRTHLQAEVEQKSDSLRSLVKNNFDRFVGAKSAIDQVHAQVKQDFLGRQPGASGTDAAKEASLVDVMKETLNEAGAKGAQIFEPVVRHKATADRLRGALATLEQYRTHLDTPARLQRCLDAGDDEALVREYKAAQKLFAEAQKQPTSQEEKMKQRMLDRIWHIVQDYMHTRELELLASLEDQDVDANTIQRTCLTLLDIGVEVNPFFRAFQQRSTHLRENIIMQTEIQRVAVEIKRREILNDTKAAAKDLRTTSIQSYILSEARDDEPTATESPEVLRMWNTVDELVKMVFTSQIPRLKELWQIHREMTNASRSALLPIGPNGTSRRFHSFTAEERNNARNAAENMALLICDSILDFFLTRPINELPPIYAQAIAKERSTGDADGAAKKTHRKRVSAVPELPAIDNSKPGEFAFLPTATTALSTSVHLAHLMDKLIKGASEIVGLTISSRVEDSARAMLSKVRERFVRAICELWHEDCLLLPSLEDWQHSFAEDDRVTSMPRTMYLLNSAVIDGLRRVVFADPRGHSQLAGSRSGSPAPTVLPSPNPKLLENIRMQFAKNMYATMNSFVAAIYDPDSVDTPTREAAAASESAAKTEGGDDAKALLLISNIERLQADYVSKLVKKLENAFMAGAGKEAHDLRSMLQHHEQGVFKRYVRPRCAQIDGILAEKLAGQDYTAMHYPKEVDPYINEIVLQHVVVLSQVNAAGQALEARVMAAVVEHTFQTVQDILARHRAFNIGAMLKITTEMELLTQTLGPFMTQQAIKTNDNTLDQVESRTDRNLPTPGQQQDVKKILSRARKAIGAYGKVFRKEL